MPQPLIGVTTYRFHNKSNHPQFAVGEMYIRAIERAGGLPLMLPLGLNEATLQALLGRLDGVLLTGGGDIDPAIYGHPNHPLVDDVDCDRDRVELHLAQHLLHEARPVLGICRGFQLLNVALGGTLYEDIVDQKDAALRHSYYPDFPRDYLPHPVTVTPDSRLGQILGQTQNVPVNSLHHQGVENLGRGLQASAYAPDGLVEAFELPEHPFAMAVQWHPEWLPEHDHMQAIFRAFVQAAQARQ